MYVYIDWALMIPYFTWLFPKARNNVISFGGFSCVTHNRHCCCVTHQTCLLCDTTDMPAE